MRFFPRTLNRGFSVFFLPSADVSGRPSPFLLLTRPLNLFPLGTSLRSYDPASFPPPLFSECGERTLPFDSADQFPSNSNHRLNCLFLLRRISETSRSLKVRRTQV